MTNGKVEVTIVGEGNGGGGEGGRGGTGRNTRMIEEIWKIGIDGKQVDWKWISATH